MLRSYYLLLTGIALTALGCSQDTPKSTATSSAPAKPQLMQPFTFHKTLEVSPGQYFDVMSWGRGGGDKRSLLILRSDSASHNFTTTTGDLDNALTDVFNADMDADGNPELLIESKGKDTVNFSSIQAFEFNDSKAQKLDFPKLTSSQKKGYRGDDNFYMKDGKLIREFPLFSSNDSTAKPTGQKRVLEYNLRSNNLTVKDLSADTLKKTSSTAAPATTQQGTSKSDDKKSDKSTSSSKSSKKKESSSGSKKKKKHHHRG